MEFTPNRSESGGYNKQTNKQQVMLLHAQLSLTAVWAADSVIERTRDSGAGSMRHRNTQRITVQIRLPKLHVAVGLPLCVMHSTYQ